jgi:hypothetical protein
MELELHFEFPVKYSLIIFLQKINASILGMKFTTYEKPILVRNLEG